MTLIDKIKHAQMLAGEQAVVDHLKETTPLGEYNQRVAREEAMAEAERAGKQNVLAAFTEDEKKMVLKACRTIEDLTDAFRLIVQGALREDDPDATMAQVATMLGVEK